VLPDFSPMNKRSIWAWAAGVFVVLGFIACWPALKHFPRIFELKDLGDLGSYVQGPVASLWALAGICLVVETLNSQRKQLKEQEAQFKEQHESIKRQSFEASFFQLLNLQNTLVSEMREEWQIPKFSGQGISVENHSAEGRACFKIAYGILKAAYTHRRDHKQMIETVAPEQTAVKFPPEHQAMTIACEALSDKKQHVLDHYFRIFYHTIKFVKNSAIEPKRRYTSLARAQLSAYELVLLFYDGLIPKGEKLKPLIEEFGLLEHLDTTLLLNPDHLKYYDEGAYK
jgi:hypothetical protein